MKIRKIKVIIDLHFLNKTLILSRKHYDKISVTVPSYVDYVLQVD